MFIFKKISTYKECQHFGEIILSIRSYVQYSPAKFKVIYILHTFPLVDTLIYPFIISFEF